MSGNDGDFAAYLAARWPSMVRALVLLGCPQPEAEQIAQTGLAYCYGDWGEVRRAADVDVHVYTTVLACLRTWRRHAGITRLPAPERFVSDDDADEMVAVRRALEAQLARLSPHDRELLVLRFVADLDDAQVAGVLEEPVGSVERRINQALSRLDLTSVAEV